MSETIEKDGAEKLYVQTSDATTHTNFSNSSKALAVAICYFVNTLTLGSCGEIRLYLFFPINYCHF